MSQIARLCRWRCACGVALLILAGCKTTPDLGPVYKLQMPELPAPVAPVAVTVTDKRPANEQAYHRGAVQPANYQDGIEKLALTNFDPQVTDIIRQILTQRLSTLSDPPVWADVEIRRFRAWIDRREILAAEYKQQIINDSPAVGFGVGPGSGGAANLAGGLATGIMAAAATAQKLRAVEEDESAWDHALSGITCEVQLHVELHWKNGKQTAFDIEAKSHAMSNDDAHFADLTDHTKWDISPTVEQAVLQATDRLIIDVKSKLPAATTRQTAPQADPSTGPSLPSDLNEFESNEPVNPQSSPVDVPDTAAGAAKL